VRGVRPGRSKGGCRSKRKHDRGNDSNSGEQLRVRRHRQFGDRGEINGQSVVFAHHGALAAMRVLAAKMPVTRRSK